MATFQLTEVPTCPHCGQFIDTNFRAEEFIPRDGNIPNGNSMEDFCGNCNAVFTATPTQDKQAVNFESQFSYE